MKRLACIVLSLLLLSSLVACQPDASQTGSPPNESSSDVSASSDSSGEAGAYDTPLEISMSVRYADQCGTHVRNEIIKEKFNLTFEYVPVNWSDWNEKIRTWIAMDDAPDILHMDLKGAQSNEFKSWAKQGAFSPFLEEYFASRPNLKKVYDESPTIPYLKVDGVLYGWPGLNSYRGYDDRVDDPYWTYRRDWAKAVGKYKENDIYTWEEWLDLIRTVMEEDPGNNGPGNTAGLVMPPWAFPHAPVLLIGPPATDGNESCSYFQQDGVYVWPPATEEYKTGVKITYDMYQEGLIYQDNILFTSSENVDMFVGGLAFAVYAHFGSLNSSSLNMLEAGIIDERSDIGSAAVLAYDGKMYLTQVADYWGVTCFRHDLEQEKIDRAMDLWEYLRTNEGIQMRWMGKEGVDYRVTGPDLYDVEVLWEYDEETQSYVDPYADFKFEEAQPAGSVPTPAPYEDTFRFDEHKKIFDVFNSGEVDAVLKPYDYFISFGSAPNKDKYGDFASIVKERFISLLAQPDIDVEAEWDAFIEEMMPQVQPVLDEINNGELQ